MRIVLLLLCLAAPLRAELITPVSDLVHDKDRYDHRWLCMVGKASAIDKEISPVKRHKYWTAWLAENGGRILMFAYGDPPFENDETIEACGLFTRLKKARSTGEVFHDEFNVTRVLRGPLIRSGRVVITDTGIQTAGR